MAKDKRLYKDRKEYLKAAASNHRRKKKKKAKELLGGKCSKCGYSKYLEVLEFHHKNPEDKEFGIAGNGACTSWERIKKEIKKCILLCANCHRELHVEQDYGPGNSKAIVGSTPTTVVAPAE